MINRTLILLVDVSGSMYEMGKIHLQRHLCRYVSRVARFQPDIYAGTEVRLYQWGETVSLIAQQPNGDIPELQAAGSADIVALSHFLSTQPDGQNQSLLILSDGNFSQQELLHFQQQCAKSPTVRVRAVAVGADADLLTLRKMATNDTVYLAEDISQAMNSALLEADVPFSPPVPARFFPLDLDEEEDNWDA